jgi:hypothetical protein
MLLRSTDPSRQAIDPGSLDQKPVLALVLIAVRAVTHDIPKSILNLQKNRAISNAASSTAVEVTLRW